MGARMRAPRTIFRRKIGSFEVNACDRRSDLRITRAGGRQRAHAMCQGRKRASDQGRAKATDAVAPAHGDNAANILQAERLGVEAPPFAAVDLQVEERGRDPASLIVGHRR